MTINCYCEPIIVVHTDPDNRFKKTFTIDRSCRRETVQKTSAQMSETAGPPGVSDEFGDSSRPVSSDTDSNKLADSPEGEDAPSEGLEQASEQRKRGEGS